MRAKKQTKLDLTCTIFDPKAETALFLKIFFTEDFINTDTKVNATLV